MNILNEPKQAYERLFVAWENKEVSFNRCCGGAIQYGERVQGSGGNSHEDKLLDYCEMSTKYDEAKKTYEQARKRAVMLIDTLDDEAAKKALKARYVCIPAITYPAIAAMLQVSERQAYRTVKRGVEKLEKRYPQAFTNARLAS